MRMRPICSIFLQMTLLSAACNLTNPPASEASEAPELPPPSATHADPPTPSETPDPFPDPVIATVGEEEVVFDWTTDRCEPENLPDLPTRAFRDAEGQVNMIISHYVNYRAVGPDLDHLTMDCDPLMHSTKNADPTAFSDWEWIGSTYTEDGQTIYALVHNEYQGHTHAGQCPQGEYFPCWYNTVSIVKSTDAGRTFSHVAEPPEHLVATLPYPYIAGEGPNGIRAPSNILKGEDGFYYSYLAAATEYPQSQWVCLMRTDDLEDPKAWRFWDGEGFDGQFIDPYVDEGEDHRCPPLEWDNIGASLNDSITYNTYLDQYVLIGISADRIDNREVWGVYYAFSDDLVHWSRRKLLLELPLPWTVEHHTHTSHLYPSLLDPDSESRNFSTTDKTAYLYITRQNFGQGSLDRDLIRFPVEFFPAEEDVPALLPTQEEALRVEGQDLFEPAVGDWDSVDPADQSRQTLAIEKTEAGDYRITLVDDGSSFCGEDSNGNLVGVELSGSGVPDSNILTIDNAAFTCLTSPRQAAGSVTFLLTYNASSDTLEDGFGAIWRRAND